MLAALDLGKKQETLQEMLDMVRLKIDLFAGNAPQFDDITMMVIRYKE